MIVGLAGRARSGKDTVANILRVERRFVQLSFAAPMRRFVANLLGCHVADLEQIKEDPHELLGGKTPRFAMQTLGTEWGRDTIAGDLWIRCCLAAARREAQCGHDVVISDVRFENEAAAIRAAGGVVWHISRPGAAIAESAHRSEAGLAAAPQDETIVNDGTLEKLAARVRYHCTRLPLAS
jgi:hypothetical protein